MECTFYMILTVALFAYAAYGQCPKINERSSDSFPDMLDIVVTGSKSSNFQKKSDILQGIKPDGSIKHSPGIFLTSNDKITIKSTFADNVLMTVKEFRVELFKANETTLQMFSGAQTKYDETEPVNKQIFDKIDFDLKKGILGVDRLVLTFIAPEGEVKVRNIFMKVCIETGWCNWQKWGACSKSCGGGTQGRARTCDCPNPDPMVFECPTDGPTSQNQECNPECCPQPPTWGNWAVWAACSVTCGGGSRSRSRKCIDDKCPDTTLDCQGKKTDKEDCNDECCPIPFKWTKWNKWSPCSVTCGDGSMSRSRRCRKSKCPGDYTGCEGPKKETDTCSLPCCEKIIDFKHKKGVKIFVRDEESTKYLRVLRGHKKSLFLVNNSLVTEYIQVKLGQDYTVLELGVTTRLSSYVKVTSEPEEWPKEDNMSRVPPHKIHAKRWNKHKFDMRPGVGPINYIKLTFGFPYGEINVKDLFLIVCPV